MDRLIERARMIAADEDAGASEIVRRLVPVLDEALALGPDATRGVVRAVCATQPGMAPIWNACAAAIADLTSAGRWARYAQAQEHYQRAIVRVGADAVLELLTRAGGDADRGGSEDPPRRDETGRPYPPPRVVTWSYSATVAAVLARVASTRPLTVVCAEGRPRFEGRRLATTLAASGARVILTTDAGATADLDGVAAIVVGADAVLGAQWINKVGTRALAAAALQIGCPVVVTASRDKAVAPALEGKLAMLSGRPRDVWIEAPPDVEISVPIFERIPAELATWFATDAGLLTPSDLPAFVVRNEAEIGALLEMF